MRGSAVISALSIGALATVVGFACGRATSSGGPARPALPAAGTAQDDGSGFLARASARGADLVGGETEADRRVRTYGGAAYADEHEYYYDPYTAGSYGDPFAGNAYGGALYANYQAPVFDYYSYRSFTPAHHAADYRAISVSDAGAIAGRVRWPRAPRVPAELPAPRLDGCPPTLPNDSLRLDAQGHVAQAVVFLADIRSGKSGAAFTDGAQALPLGGLLQQRGCRFQPHVQIAAPIGARLELVNGNAAPRTWTGRVWTGLSRDLAFSVEVPGGHASQWITLGRSGFTRVRADDDPAGAWVVVAGHPYYALTDARGRFRLDEVPPGEYTLTVWHEPVITGVDAQGQPVLTPAITTSKRVRVTGRRTTELTLDLPPTR